MITVIIMLVVLLLVTPIAVHQSAKNSWQFTYVPEGHIVFIVRGETLERTIVNVKDHYLDVMTHKIIEGEEPEKNRKLRKECEGYLAGFLRKHWGIYWVSLLYPAKKIHRFKITRDRLKKSSGEEDLDVREMIERDAGEYEVSSLRWKFPRPILARDVELGGDRTKIDVLVFTAFKVVNPYLPVFAYDGDFFELLESAVNSAVIDYCSGDKTYEDILREPKGEGSKFSKRIMKINVTKKGAPDSIVTAVGIEIVAAWVYAIDLSPQDQELIDAARAEKVAKFNAQALVAEADGKAQAEIRLSEGIAEGKRIIAGAEADRFGKLIKAQTDNGVGADVAAHTVRDDVRTANVGGKDSKITTWVDGANSVPTIPLD
jgi:hypothetical protein